MTFSWREGRRSFSAVWAVSPDRQSVTPTNEQARMLSASFRRGR
ncbi:MAG: hypothetical protein R3A48_14375 [Polyangiales bacterium]